MITRGILTRRAHHLLSELEAAYFFLIERRPSTVDIREQWPILDIDRTLELCAKYGVRHAYRRGYPEPITIDFLITEDIDGHVSHRAASIKTPEDAKDPNVRQRLAVEHAWCAERGIPWTLVDTQHLTKATLQNLRFMRTWFRHRFSSDPVLEARFLELFNDLYSPHRLLGNLLEQLSRSLQRPLPLIQDVFRYCAWSNEIPASLTHRISLNAPLVLNAD